MSPRAGRRRSFILCCALPSLVSPPPPTPASAAVLLPGLAIDLSLIGLLFGVRRISNLLLVCPSLFSKSNQLFRNSSKIWTNGTYVVGLLDLPDSSRLRHRSLRLLANLGPHRTRTAMPGANGTVKRRGGLRVLGTGRPWHAAGFLKALLHGTPHDEGIGDTFQF